MTARLCEVCGYALRPPLPIRIRGVCPFSSRGARAVRTARPPFFVASPVVRSAGPPHFRSLRHGRPPCTAHYIVRFVPGGGGGVWGLSFLGPKLACLHAWKPFINCRYLPPYLYLLALSSRDASRLERAATRVRRAPLTSALPVTIPSRASTSLPVSRDATKKKGQAPRITTAEARARRGLRARHAPSAFHPCIPPACPPSGPLTLPFQDAFPTRLVGALQPVNTEVLNARSTIRRSGSGAQTPAHAARFGLCHPCAARPRAAHAPAAAADLRLRLH